MPCEGDSFFVGKLKVHAGRDGDWRVENQRPDRLRNQIAKSRPRATAAR
jgi:hypothetical protein